MRARWTLAGLLCLCAGSCVYSPHFEDGKTRCSSAGECPPGFTCRADQLCWRPSAADATTMDAAPVPPDGPPLADASGLADASPPSDPRPPVDTAALPADMALPPADLGRPPDMALPPADMAPPPPDVPPDATISPPDQREVACADPPECQQKVGFACLGNSVVRCDLDQQGCLEIRNQTACQAGLVCTGSPPNAACR
jgi:hypothetical protein